MKYITKHHCWLFLCILLLNACHKKNNEQPAPEIIQADVIISNMLPLSGPKTTIVTLTGSGFGITPEENEVSINGKTCSVLEASETKLKVIIPPKARSGSLIVKVKDKTGESPRFTYEITDIKVSTFAGSIEGFADGTGIAAQFYNPYVIIFDKDGNMYVSDTNNHKIRKITPSGVVSTFAGSTAGFADGSGINAQFYGPAGLAFDKDGNLYVADYVNCKIRKISPSGVVSTFVGSTAGFEDGVGTVAKFNQPAEIVIDESDNLYVMDQGNHSIRKITPSGVVSTFAGNGTKGFTDGVGNAAQFNNPAGLGIDKKGNLYVADSENFRIRKVSPEGLVSTLAGSTSGFADGLGSNAQFSFNISLTLDEDENIYVADYWNNRIRKITQNGLVSTFLGGIEGQADGIGSTAQFYLPSGVVFDSNGNLYVSERGNDRIRKVELE